MRSQLRMPSKISRRTGRTLDRYSQDGSSGNMKDRPEDLRAGEGRVEEETNLHLWNLHPAMRAIHSRRTIPRSRTPRTRPLTVTRAERVLPDLAQARRCTRRSDRDEPTSTRSAAAEGRRGRAKARGRVARADDGRGSRVVRHDEPVEHARDDGLGRLAHRRGVPAE